MKSHHILGCNWGMAQHIVPLVVPLGWLPHPRLVFPARPGERTILATTSWRRSEAQGGPEAETERPAP